MEETRKHTLRGIEFDIVIWDNTDPFQVEGRITKNCDVFFNSEIGRWQQHLKVSQEFLQDEQFNDLVCARALNGFKNRK